MLHQRTGFGGWADSDPSSCQHRHGRCVTGSGSGVEPCGEIPERAVEQDAHRAGDRSSTSAISLVDRSSTKRSRITWRRSSGICATTCLISRSSSASATCPAGSALGAARWKSSGSGSVRRRARLRWALAIVLWAIRNSQARKVEPWSRKSGRARSAPGRCARSRPPRRGGHPAGRRRSHTRGRGSGGRGSRRRRGRPGRAARPAGQDRRCLPSAGRLRSRVMRSPRR